MMSQEQNHALTRTDKGTLMGDLFRRYWIPALLSDELDERDGALDGGLSGHAAAPVRK